MGKTKVIFDKTTKIIKDIATIKGASVTVGIHEKAKDYSSGADIVTVAATQEYGSKELGIPEIAYMRNAFDENIQQVHQMMAVGIFDIVLGSTTVKKVLSGVGFFAREATKTKLEMTKQPSNAQSTINQKGFDNRGIHTRHLKNAISYEVQK